MTASISAAQAPTQRFVAWQHDSARLGFVWPEHDFYPAVYPPAYYCLVAPLAAVPYRAAVPLWLVLMLGCYAATAWCVQVCARADRLPQAACGGCWLSSRPWRSCCRC
jgi:hypothetical protein